MKYRVYFSRSRCRAITVCIWLVSIAFPFLYFEIGAVNYYMLFACVVILSGLVVMVIVYIKVYRFLTQRTGAITYLTRTHLRNLIQEKRVTRTFLVILLVFILTYISAASMAFVLYFWETDNCVARHVLRDVQSMIISSNSCVNPFICIARLDGFYRSVGAILQWIWRQSYNSKRNRLRSSKSHLKVKMVSYITATSIDYCL